MCFCQHQKAGILLAIQASSTECKRRSSAFNARHIITEQRKMFFLKTGQAISTVLEGYIN